MENSLGAKANWDAAPASSGSQTLSADAAVRPATPEPGTSAWLRLLETATREVFETMLGEPASPAVCNIDELPSARDFTALVALSGALEGSLRVRCPAVSACLMGSRMVGTPLDLQDELVVDALGEIANMVAGNFKSKIPGLADACRVSVPTVFRGQEFTVESMARGEILESCFLFHGSPFWVSLDLWPEAA
jgi:chemotaxis protein CheX